MEFDIFNFEIKNIRMSDRLKDKVLNFLLNSETRITDGGYGHGEKVYGSYTAKIESETKIEREKLLLVLDSLYSEKYISKSSYTESTIWSITDKGKNAILTKYFSWYSYDNFLKLMPIIISILSLIVSIIALCISM